MSEDTMEAAPGAVANSAGFFRRHLNGDYTLGRSYWVHTFAVQWLLSAALVVVALWLSEHFPARYASTAVLTLYTAMLALWLWAIAGTWASASKHVGRGGKAGWASAAKAAIVLGVLKTLGDVGQAVPALEDHLRVAAGYQYGAKPKLEVRADGRSILLVGGIQDGTADELEAALKVAPAVKTVVLQSEGGWIREGERVGEVIRRRGLDTYVETLCSSACTVAFLASKNRAASPTARIGFHAPRAVGGGNFSDTRLRAIYEAAGLPAAFISRALSTPNSEMWFPTAEELVAARVVTRRSLGWETAAMATSTRSREALETGLKKIDLFAAFALREPVLWKRAVDEAWEKMQHGATDAELMTAIRALLMPAILSYLPHARDGVLVSYHALVLEQLAAIQSRDVGACAEFAFPTGNYLRVMAVMPSELREREVVLLTRILREFDGPRPKPTQTQLEQVLKQVFAAMSQEQLQILSDDSIRARSSSAAICATAVAYFSGLSLIPESRRGQALRAIYGS